MTGMVTVVGSVKGAPGATCTATALALQAGAVLVEADPAGGVLHARFATHPEPGLATLAAVSRHGGVPDLHEHTQRLALGVDAVIAPADPQAAAVAVSTVAMHPAEVFAAPTPVVVDVGRLLPRTPSRALASAADAVVVVARPDFDGLAALAHGLSALAGPLRDGRVGIVLVGRGRYDAREIERALEVPVWACFPRDRVSAAILTGRAAPTFGWRRFGLGGYATRLARRLQSLATPPAVEEAPRRAPAFRPVFQPQPAASRRP